MTESPPSSERPGHIRSFVLRRGHLSDAQRDAWETLLPRFGVPDHDELINFPGLFGRVAPVVLEIGFGMGHTTAQIAAARPAIDFLGIEVYTPGVGSLLKTLAQQDLSNVRVIQRDAVEVLERIAPASLAGVHIYFPDPWPKARHVKRRMMNDGPVNLIAAKLKPGGEFRFGTVHPIYVRHALMIMQRHRQQFDWLCNSASDFQNRPGGWPETRYEAKARRLGHEVWYFRYRRKDA